MAEETPKYGSFVHIELPAKDIARAKAFYGEVFDWKFEDVPEMNYTLFKAPGPPDGGIRSPMEDDPGGILNHILVKSVDESCKRIEEEGGKILMPKTEVPGVGWWALFKDPEENVLAVYQSLPRQE